MKKKAEPKRTDRRGMHTYIQGCRQDERELRDLSECLLASRSERTVGLWRTGCLHRGLFSP
ncbi:hypothetical protein CSUI_004237 [Cystoisospora suis]|uniref:Uncharacterized protein n=1 Tax=Cystoisospora suis TaxID=483139 RepID=A0A2C6L2G1_9APIC|nr:hypothetical protein CSUI_004237 [Cystoisospora suis]